MDLASTPSGFGDVVSGHMPLTGGSFGYARGRVTSDEYRAWGWPDNVGGSGSQQQTGSGRLYNTSPLGAQNAQATYPGDLGSVFNIGGGNHVVDNGSFAYSAAYNTAGTFTCMQNSTANSSAFEHGIIIGSSRNTGNNVNLPVVSTLVGAPTYLSPTGGSTATITQTLGDIISAPAFIGSVTVTQLSNFQAKCALALSPAITLRKAYEVIDATGSGMVTQIGLDIPALAAGSTNNWGIRNAAQTIYTPPARVLITAAGNTISPNATCVEIRNNSGSNVTLTSAPTIPIAGAVAGQILIITCSSATGTNDIILQSQGTLASSGLSLGATTRTIRKGGSISLVFNSNLSEWVEFGYQIGSFG